MIAEIYYQIPTTPGLLAFYTEHLGMVLRWRGDQAVLGFNGVDSALCFAFTAASPGVSAAQVQDCSQGQDFYWKVGITVPSLDAAVAFLCERGVVVSEPAQFMDIGYLAHLRDPAGLSIELLQRDLANKQGRRRHAVADGAVLAHLTLRVSDLAAARRYLEGRLGMRLMSIQPVAAYGFTLYFFAWSDEPLPESELSAVGNRPWLWARPYTLIELQHLHAPGAAIAGIAAGTAGFAGFTYNDADGGGYVDAATLAQQLAVV